MTFDPSIPQATDLISNSQGQLLTNFTQLNTQFGVDHVAFYTGSANGDGTHKKITFDNAPSEPNPTGTISNIFPLLASGRQELFFKNASQKTQLTGVNSIGAQGSITIQGGIVVKWGTLSFSGSTAGVSFGTAFPNNAFSVSCMADTTSPSTNGVLGVNGFSTSGFTCYQNGSGALSGWYIAIGN